MCMSLSVETEMVVVEEGEEEGERGSVAAGMMENVNPEKDCVHVMAATTKEPIIMMRPTVLILSGLVAGATASSSLLLFSLVETF